MKDDPREAAFLYGNRNHEYSEAPTWKGDTMCKDAPFTDQYHALVNGEWVECEQVRVIRTANHNSCTCRNMCPWCRCDDEG